MPIHLCEKHRANHTVSHKKLKLQKSATHSKRTTQKNTNNNHLRRSSATSTLTQGHNENEEALPEVTDLEFNFNYELEDSDEDAKSSTRSPRIVPPKKKSPPKWMSYSSAKTTKSTRYHAPNTISLLDSTSRRTVSSRGDVSSQYGPFSDCLTYRHFLRPALKFVRFDGFTKPQQVLFNSLLKILAVLTLILALFYYFLSALFFVPPRLKIQHENIYITL